MKVPFASIVPLCLLFAGLTLSSPPASFAQHEAGQMQSPSKYLFLTNVDIKPEESGAFGKIEKEEVDAMHADNAPGYYLGMWAITGPTHAVYMHGFDSFAELQKTHDDRMAMSTLMDTLRTDDASEASLISDRYSSVYSYEKDLSLNPDRDLSKQRFMRILLFHVRSGKDQDFERVVKLFIKAYQTSIPDAHWAMFEKMYGVGSDNTYILVTTMESLSAVDVMHENGKKFDDAVGADQLQLLRNGIDATVESSESDLFALSPDLSYVPASWITASPDFWGKK
jgi:hypothetical protein